MRVFVFPSRFFYITPTIQPEDKQEPESMPLEQFLPTLIILLFFRPFVLAIRITSTSQETFVLPKCLLLVSPFV